MERRRREVRKVLPEWDGKEEESTEDEEEDEEEVEAEAEQEEESDEEDEVVDTKEADEAIKPVKNERKRITIKLKGSKACKVCKAADHQAGFVGSIYFDCPNRPCFLCKKPGHTTMTCPHRIASEHGVTSVPRRHSLGLLDFVAERQLKGPRASVKMPPVIPNKVDAAVLRLHSRRVTYLEFHPTRDNIVISGDKKGQLGIWDFETMEDRTVYDNVHSLLVNSIKFHPGSDEVIYTASSDGTVHSTDLETGVPNKLLDMNPDGWAGPSTWKMMYGMDLNTQRNLVLAADNHGFMYRIDMRTGKEVGDALLLHTKGTKVVGLHCNPVDPDIFLTCGNDHMARMWDLRLMDSQTNLAELPHPRVVNSAYFSPISGSKILTTCQDNRLRVWDCLFGDLEQPSREIVHSHDFNRYLTAFRAEWDPKDQSESLVVIGRYISDNFNGVALHPVDFIDTSNGQLLAEAVDTNITTISPVNKLHPRLDIMVTGSSRSLFSWRPKEDNDEDEIDKAKAEVKIFNFGADDTKKGKGKGKHKPDEDDSDDFSKKKSKALPTKRSGRQRC